MTAAIYQYDAFDQAIVDQRVTQFKNQLSRHLKGELSEEDFRPLRLQNGLYIQRHAPMLRIAIPYGLLNTKQLRTLADIAQQYDRGYAHFTTRQNLQYNWIPLEQTAEVLEKLATVQMHAIQTSGNCIRNITSDALAGIAPDEAVDPRPFAEILRQWSTLHPEFAYLPRKFKIAITGATEDRASILWHDIGLRVVKNEIGEIGFTVFVGGGMGRTPITAKKINAFVPWQQILGYLESIVRVYNLHGRRDNMYKSRIKILVKSIGIEAFSEQVNQTWKKIKDQPRLQIPAAELERVSASFTTVSYSDMAVDTAELNRLKQTYLPFARWVKLNVLPHKHENYASVTFSLKHPTQAPGDATTEQMLKIADLADQYSQGTLVVSHKQNLVLNHVHQNNLYELWKAAEALQVSSPTVGLLTDMIACPGGDFCSLANAKSISVSEAIHQKFDDLDYLYELGNIRLNISGCMNSCGHHHAADIGILGVDKDGQDWYQITLGGSDGSNKGHPTVKAGKVIGPSFSEAAVPDVIETIINTYISNRAPEEALWQTIDRIGLEPFKAAVYPDRIEKRQPQEVNNG
jgi:sulfite reductase (NADPH) hemoprotein beta-component